MVVISLYEYVVCSFDLFIKLSFSLFQLLVICSILSCNDKLAQIFDTIFNASNTYTTSDSLTHICLMVLSIHINWLNPFPILGVSGVFVFFFFFILF